MSIRLSSISAMAKNRVIGVNNTIPWHIPEDFKHFKRTTMDKPMIMGRKTFESLPGMLKGRTHIVVSRNDYEHPEAVGAISLEDGIEKGRKVAEKHNQNEVFIIGGGEIYKQSMPLIDRIYLTLVHKEFEGDAFFPEFDWNEWTIAEEERHEGDPAYTFFTLDRKA